MVDQVAVSPDEKVGNVRGYRLQDGSLGTEEQFDEEVLRKYSHPAAPPPPGSEESKLFMDALARKRRREMEINAGEVRVLFTEDSDPIQELRDAGVLSKEALEKKALAMRKRRDRLMFWSGWLFFMMLMSALGGAGYYYGINNMTSGRFTVPFECKIPFGDSELTARRHLSFPVKRLDGWQWTPPWASVSEEVEVVLKGDQLTILGIDKKGKPWRKDFGKGDTGVAKFPVSDTYWFVGKNIKETTPVIHENFCK